MTNAPKWRPIGPPHLGAGLVRSGAVAPGVDAPQAPWHFLYFLPDPHQQGSLRPIFVALRIGCRAPPLPPTAVDVVASLAPTAAPVMAAGIASDPSPVTSGRLSCMRRTGGGGGCTTVTRKLVCVTSWR